MRTADGREVRGRQVVLCAGAYGSPAILLRSGIGPAADLRALGIPVVADRPGVGAHLLDHPDLIFANGDDLAAVPASSPAVRAGRDQSAVPLADQGAQSAGDRGDRPLHHLRLAAATRRAGAGSPSSGSIWKWPGRRAGCA